MEARNDLLNKPEVGSSVEKLQKLRSSFQVKPLFASKIGTTKAMQKAQIFLVQKICLLFVNIIRRNSRFFSGSGLSKYLKIRELSQNLSIQIYNRVSQFF